jgi:hypothetical protein
MSTKSSTANTAVDPLRDLFGCWVMFFLPVYVLNLTTISAFSDILLYAFTMYGDINIMLKSEYEHTNYA